jgi:phosphate transport system ATP-binding protein
MSPTALTAAPVVGTSVADAAAPVRIACRDLSFFYGGAPALKNINLDFLDRQVTALIGPSGCGKSTLLRTFNRIYSLYPDHARKARSSLDGRNVSRPPST